MNELRVAAHTNVHHLADSIVQACHRKGTLKLAAIGGGAICQAVKAIAIAREQLNVVFWPHFRLEEIESAERTVMILTVEEAG